MANPEHVEIVKQGTEILSQWRQENPDEKLDLRKANLRAANLRATNLSYADLRNADLKKANLSYAYLSYADLSYANLNSADLSYANLNATDLSYASLISANLREANLNTAKLISAKLISADLRFAYLESAYLRSINLISADLTEANLRAADLIFATLISAKLIAADLSEADLRAAKLNSANLSEANLSATQALHTCFERATLTGACIKDWKLNSQTNLNNTESKYIFLDFDPKHNHYSDRRPSRGMFAPGDFAKLVQQSISTIDLVFHSGIHWQAFADSFQTLQHQVGSDKLEIQAIETKEEQDFIIRVITPPDVDKVKIQTFMMQEYRKQLKVIESKDQAQRDQKDVQNTPSPEQLDEHRQNSHKNSHKNSHNLMDIVRIMAANESTKGDFRF